MFPYRDENETIRTPVMTLALIAANAAMWILVQGAGQVLPLATSVCNLGLIPGELTGTLPPGKGFPMGEGLVCVTDSGSQYLHVLTHMFLHGSWMHLIGNMWFLMVGYWALIQILSGLISLGSAEMGGVAFWAHVGGFVAGIVLVRLFARGDYVSAHRATYWQPRHLGWQ